MKRKNRIEAIDNQMFRPLDETEALAVSGGARKVTGKATYKNGSADAEVDFAITF